MENKDKNGNTILMIAVKEKNISETTWLLSKGSFIDTIDIDKNTPLHIAVLNNDEPMVSLLLSNKCLITISNAKQDTPLKIAYRLNYTDIIDLIEAEITRRMTDTEMNVHSDIKRIGNILAYKELIECFEKKVKATENKTIQQKIEEIMLQYISL